MSFIQPKNWAEFQHYKDRAPAWIKLHRGILDDYDFACLPVASRALAPVLWLLASQYDDGKIPAEVPRMAHRLRWSEHELVEAIIPLIEKGFFLDASGLLAERKQIACLEREEETEIEEEEETALVQPAAALVLAEPEMIRNLPKPRQPTADRFEEFWLAYPVKKGRKAAERHWKREGCDAIADQILAHVQMMKVRDNDWKRGYAPHGSTYVNGRGWDDFPKAAPTPELSKSAQAIQRLEVMKHGGLDAGRNHDGFSEANLPRLGTTARFGAFGRNGNGMGGGT